jgi:prolyl-tRNA editing enzyme YbaK/EbsC (Cys-tRNA(Pro) deacylase)
MNDNPLMEATNKLMDAILPSEHAKRYHETQARFDKERAQLVHTLIFECAATIENLAMAIRCPNSATIDLEYAAEHFRKAQAAAEQLSPEE